MQTLIDTATSTFETTTGITLSSVVDFLTTQLTLIIGTGLGVLQNLMPWIVALIAISAVVYFAYRALHFFRH